MELKDKTLFLKISSINSKAIWTNDINHFVLARILRVLRICLHPEVSYTSLHEEWRVSFKDCFSLGSKKWGSVKSRLQAACVLIGCKAPLSRGEQRGHSRWTPWWTFPGCFFAKVWLTFQNILLEITCDCSALQKWSVKMLWLCSKWFTSASW